MDRDPSRPARRTARPPASTLIVAPFLLAPFLLAPAQARAAGSSKLPQMDFASRLTLTQVGWMAVILVGLYLVLAFWALPRIGAGIADRQQRIRTDLDAARLAREGADRAIAELERAIEAARSASERTINEAIGNAKARAEASRAASGARLEERLARAETEIAEARARAMSHLVPVAREVAEALVRRVSGLSPSADTLARALGAAGAPMA